ncbi:P-type conjugative transfer protein TrbJ [Fodinibius roseus]|uniref:P-type conjugative transfer protein TrbJ n=1 Tax=Fodinibius roseus TaxID=1194090 RepID=A0A1M5KPG5_9BACT|nr:hypothetical protein [Fodinibius roseus]SHG54677.1 P-type conjugative transfer protein TrbJ [Fodinibius roseus]
MKTTITISTLIISLCLTTVSKAQFAVFDSFNATLNKSQIVKQLQELEQMARQIKTMKDQLSYAKRQFEQQRDNLRQLPNASWNSISDVNDNIDQVLNASQNMAYMEQHLQQKYKNLYNTNKRLLDLQNNPKKYEEYQQKRAKHLDEEATDVMVTAEENLQLTPDSYEFLKSVQGDMNRENLSPQQMRQVQAKVNALSSQQLIEIKRLIAQHASFAAIKYKQTQEGKKDQKQRAKQFNEKFDKAFEQWKERIPENERKLVPDWVKEEDN